MLRKPALAIISIFITLAGLEFAFRQFDPQTTFSDIVVHFDFGCFTKGKYYWIDLLKNRNCTLTSAAQVFPVTHPRLNNFGLRGQDITPPKPPGTKRIIFIGDSFFFGWGVEDDETVVKRTETNLRSQLLQPIEAINAGLPASGPSYYYLYLKNEALEFNPDIVVVGFYLRNDITENILHSQWLDTDSQGLPQKTTSSIYYIDSRTGNLYPNPLPLRYRIPLLRQSHLFIAIASRLTFFMHSSQPHVTYTQNQICFYKRSCHDLDQAKAKTKQLFLAMKQLADTHQQKFLIVFIPSRVQFRKDVDFVQTGIPIPLSPQEKNYPYQEFIDFFTAHDIDYLDLREHFKANDPLTGYYTLDPHWNPRGHELAAQAISSFLLDNYFK